MQSLTPAHIPTPRLTRQRWIILGLKVLGIHGPEALTVEELCRFADKTRGSFYFHFTTIDEFLAAIAVQWQQEFTIRVIERDHKTPSYGRLDLLNQLAARLDPALEAAMRRLAARNPLVAEIVRESDLARIGYLGGLYEKTGKYSAGQAKALAKIEYAALIGLQLIDPETSAEQSRVIYAEFLKLTNRA